jgi:hypothetical protein
VETSGSARFERVVPCMSFRASTVNLVVPRTHETA